MMREAGISPVDAVLRIKEDQLCRVGEEFDLAVGLKKEYGLTVIQIHEVIGWLRGVRSMEDLRTALG